jgi:hypothetical protein
VANDFVGIILDLSNFIQNERTAAFNEGLDTALASIRDFMRIELKIVDLNEDAAVPDLLYEIKDYYGKNASASADPDDR